MTRILIADDHPQIVSVLEAYAKKEGYDVLIAKDGAEALQLFEKEKVDLILLDIMMPKVDGYEVCREIRKTSHVPIIMVTARGEDFEKIMGLDIGADDYIIKPFAPGEVMARIRAIQDHFHVGRVSGVSHYLGHHAEYLGYSGVLRPSCSYRGGTDRSDYRRP